MKKGFIFNTLRPPQSIETTPYTLSKKTYSVVVPHGKRAIERLVRDGNYGWVNNSISDSHYPNERSADEKFNVLLANFKTKMGSDDVEQILRVDKYEPVTMADLLAFGAKYPNVQGEFPVVALGQSWQDSHGRIFVGLLGWSWSIPGGRGVDICYRTSGWDRHCRFAVRRVQE